MKKLLSILLAAVIASAFMCMPAEADFLTDKSQRNQPDYKTEAEGTLFSENVYPTSDESYFSKLDLKMFISRFGSYISTPEGVFPESILTWLTDAGYSYLIEDPAVDPVNDDIAPVGGAGEVSLAVFRKDILCARLYFYVWGGYGNPEEYEFYKGAVYNSEYFGTGNAFETGMSEDEIREAAESTAFSFKDGSSLLMSDGKYNVEYLTGNSGNKFILVSYHEHDIGYSLSDYDSDEAHHWRSVLNCWCHGKEFGSHEYYSDRDKCSVCGHVPSFAFAKFIGMERSEAVAQLSEKFGGQFVTENPNSFSTDYNDDMGLSFGLRYDREYDNAGNYTEIVSEVAYLSWNARNMLIVGNVRGSATYRELMNYISESDSLYKEYSVENEYNPGYVREYIVIKSNGAYVSYLKNQTAGTTDDTVYSVETISSGLPHDFRDSFLTSPLSDFIGLTRSEVEAKMKEYEFYIENVNEEKWNDTLLYYYFWFGFICFEFSEDAPVGFMQLNMYNAVNTGFECEAAPGLSTIISVGTLMDMLESGEYDIEYSETDFSEIAGLDGAKEMTYSVRSDGVEVRYRARNYEQVWNYELGTMETRLLSEEALRALRTPASSILEYSGPSYTPADANSDGEITLDDAVLTLQRAMNVGITGSVFNESAADVNSDGEITLDDAIEILKRAMNVNS